MMYMLMMCGLYIRNIVGTMNVSSACKPLMSYFGNRFLYCLNFVGINRQATCMSK